MGKEDSSSNGAENFRDASERKLSEIFDEVQDMARYIKRGINDERCEEFKYVTSRKIIELDELQVSTSLRNKKKECIKLIYDLEKKLNDHTIKVDENHQNETNDVQKSRKYSNDAIEVIEVKLEHFVERVSHLKDELQVILLESERIEERDERTLIHKNRILTVLENMMNVTSQNYLQCEEILKAHKSVEEIVKDVQNIKEESDDDIYEDEEIQNTPSETEYVEESDKEESDDDIYEDEEIQNTPSETEYMEESDKEESDDDIYGDEEIQNTPSEAEDVEESDEREEDEEILRINQQEIVNGKTIEEELSTSDDELETIEINSGIRLDQSDNEISEQTTQQQKRLDINCETVEKNLEKFGERLEVDGKIQTCHLEFKNLQNEINKIINEAKSIETSEEFRASERSRLIAKAMMFKRKVHQKGMCYGIIRPDMLVSEW